MRKAILVFALCLGMLAASAGATKDLANPKTLSEARETIKRLLQENLALKEENESLKARINELESKAGGGKTLSTAEQELLTKLKEVRSAIEKAPEGKAVYDIVKRHRVELDTLVAKVGRWPWRPFREYKPPVYYGGAYALSTEYKVIYQYPTSSQAFEVRAYTQLFSMDKRFYSLHPAGFKSTMSREEWQRILDALTEWEKAVIK